MGRRYNWDQSKRRTLVSLLVYYHFQLSLMCAQYRVLRTITDKYEENEMIMHTWPQNVRKSVAPILLATLSLSNTILLISLTLELHLVVSIVPEGASE